MAITIEDLPTGKIGFKGSAFDKWDPFASLTGADDSKEWSGIYIAPEADLAKGYLGDYADENTGKGTAYIHIVELLSPLKLLVCTDDIIGDGSVSGDVKAKHIKDNMPGEISFGAGLLIPRLGQLGYAYKGLHDSEGGMELVIPNKLSAMLTMARYSTHQISGWMVQ